MLDVKLRAAVVRAQYARRIATLFLSVLGTLLALLVFWRAGEWALDRVLFSNDAYRLRTVEITTGGGLSAEQIQRWAGVKTGQNLLALDLARIKRDLELVPAIRSATLERVLPGTLHIRVAEREPLAEVQVPRALPNGTVTLTSFDLDEDGFVLPPLSSRQRTAPGAAGDLPVITGVDVGEIAPGRKVASPAVRVALDLVAAFAESPMVGLDDLRRIDLVSPDVLQASTALGAQVTFSAKDLPRQLRRWREIFDYGQRRQWHLGWTDLAVTNNVPVRWLEASALPPVPPQIHRPLPPRRKHV